MGDVEIVVFGRIPDKLRAGLINFFPALALLVRLNHVLSIGYSTHSYLNIPLADSPT